LRWLWGLVARGTRYGIRAYMAALRRRHHEILVREYIRTGGNGTMAYRLASQQVIGKPLKNPKSAAVCACRILAYPEVQARYQELQAQMAKRADITEDKILSDYQWAIESAKSQDKPNEVTMAATAQAKLVGLLRDRVETGTVGDFDNMEDLSQVLEAVAASAGPEAALELARVFGIAAPGLTHRQPPNEETDGLKEAKPASDAVN